MADPIKTATPAQILDFGEKIGGARKDTAKRGGPKVAKPTGPAWERQYIPVQSRDGAWHVQDAKSRYGKIVARGFKSEAEARAAAPLAALSQNHRVSYDAADTYTIRRKTTKGYVKATEQTFTTREDALRHMAENARQLLGQKTPKGFGEGLLSQVKVTNTERVGPTVRTGDVTPEKFMETFRPRGVEFGHWEDRRSAVLNASYEALHDLSRITGLKPSQLTMGGELAMSFGARGTGGINSGAATYHPDYGTMNMTKPHGAGVLGHEYMHALDHLFGRNDNPALNQKVTNARGDKVWTSGGDMAYASNRTSANAYTREKALDPTVRLAMADLMETLTTKTTMEVEDAARLRKSEEYARNSAKAYLDSMRRGLTEEQTHMKRNNKPATPDQLARFDKHAAALFASPEPIQRVAFAAKGEPGYAHPDLAEISKVMKEVRGRSGFGDYYGSLDTVSHNLISAQKTAQRAADAEAGKTTGKKEATDFLKEARKLDQTRSSPYWQTRHELFARAGEAWMADKLAANKQNSPYLVHSASNVFENITGDPKPYPEGAERKAISEKFDKLFEAVAKSGIVKEAPVRPVTPVTEPAAKKSNTNKALGLLAPVGVATAMLAGANQAKAAGTSESKAAITEGAKAGGEMAVFAAGTAATTYGLMRAGMKASRAALAVQAALMVAGAAKGAWDAKPGERLAGAAKGAWDMSLPGGVVNAVTDAKQAIDDRNKLSGDTYQRTYTKGPKAGTTETVRKAA